MALNIPKGILKSKMERGIVALTILFGGIVVACYAWGITTMAGAFDKVLSVTSPDPHLSIFKREQAKTIDTRGQTVQ